MQPLGAHRRNRLVREVLPVDFEYRGTNSIDLVDRGRILQGVPNLHCDESSVHYKVTPWPGVKFAGSAAMLPRRLLQREEVRGNGGFFAHRSDTPPQKRSIQEADADPWKVAQSMEGRLEEIPLRLAVRSGLEMDEFGTMRVLDAATWQQRCQEWEKVAPAIIRSGIGSSTRQRAEQPKKSGEGLLAGPSPFFRCAAASPGKTGQTYPRAAGAACPGLAGEPPN
jgi:hypothetical protein